MMQKTVHYVLQLSRLEWFQKLHGDRDWKSKMHLE